MLKFRIWMFGKRLRPIGRFFLWFWDSLFGNVLKILLIIIIILFGIFAIAPKEAYINYDTSDFSFISLSSNSLSAHASKSLLMASNRIGFEFDFRGQIYCQEEMIMDCLSESYKVELIFEPIEEKEGLIDLTLNPRTSREIFFLLVNGKNILSDYYSDNRFVVTANNKDIILAVGGDIDISTHFMRIKLVVNEREIITLEERSHLNFIAYRDDYLYTFEGNYDGEMGVFLDGTLSISMSRIDNCGIFSTGVFDFYISAKSQQFNTINQLVLLSKTYNSNYDALNGYIERSDGICKFGISGKVSEANISGFDLFPSFIGWYTENLTLIPLSFVTSIFGGVALLNKKRK